MTMEARIRRYEKLLSMARSEYEKASAAMADARARLERTCRQLEELECYVRQIGSGTPVATAQQMHQQRLYVHQVYRAIEQQHHIIEQQRQALARLQDHWRAVRRRMDALDKLVSRLRSQMDRARLRQQQRELDERAAWRHAGRKRTHSV